MPARGDGALERDGLGGRKTNVVTFGKKKKPASVPTPVTAKPMPLGHLIPQNVQSSLTTLLNPTPQPGPVGNLGNSGATPGQRTKQIFPWIQVEDTIAGKAIDANRVKIAIPEAQQQQVAAANQANQTQQTQTQQAQATQPAAGPAGELGLSKTKKGRGRRGRVNTLLSSAGGPAETFGG